MRPRPVVTHNSFRVSLSVGMVAVVSVAVYLAETSPMTAAGGLAVNLAWMWEDLFV